MKSMTSYAARVYETDGARLAIEMKGYNSRFLDLAITLPPALQAFEGELRRLTAASCRRGKIEITLRLRELRRYPLELNEAALDAYIELAAKVALRARRRFSRTAEPSVFELLRCEGVVENAVEGAREDLWGDVLPRFRETLEAFTRERSREGARTAEALLTMLSELESAREAVCARAPQAEELIKTNIKLRFRELAVEEIDENRVLAETAMLLMKWTIAEELCRLESHLAEFRAELGRGAASGKKLDFLSQEISREINTIGAKTPLLEVSRLVVRMKESCENIREQLRNIE